ncbi:hypothetical protein DPMN_148318 [Dreissena polymorpha]|uniref:Uncharacterized protein n=1 Tax=Dreissena polymorpha TaxID=45954 RepID=A0A9D4J1E7_DREPO|nr:hypothetical protein DPMN_148318 [Dreissena polymorpha]
MSNVRRLKNTPFCVDHDFPREIQEARGRLWPKFKELKNRDPRSRVQLIYPAKLIQDGNLIQDELSEWSQFIGANRLAKLDHITPIRPHHPQVHELSLTSAERKLSQSVTHVVVPPNVPSSQDRAPMETCDPVPTGFRETAPSSTNSEVVTNSTAIPVSTTDQGAMGSKMLSITNQPTSFTSLKTPNITQYLNQPTLLLSTKPANTQDETAIKSIAADNDNPTLSRDETTPTRGRTRIANRSTDRAERRSQSSVPYRRQSSASKNKIKSDKTVFPDNNNSAVGLTSAINSIVNLTPASENTPTNGDHVENSKCVPVATDDSRQVKI